MTDRRLSGLEVEVDLVGARRAIGGLTVEADLSGLSRAISGLIIEIDCIVSTIPANAVRWAGSVFETGTASPLVYWATGAFQTSGAALVVWQGGRFDFAS